MRGKKASGGPDGSTDAAALSVQKSTSGVEIVESRGEAPESERVQAASPRSPKDFVRAIRGPLRLFLSYSHKDARLREELGSHLSSLEREGVLTVWHDQRIEAGDDWRQQIDTHLEQATVIVLLISADFLASDFCYSVEMTRALERHQAREAIVIPVILRPVDWRNSPVASLQALPTGAKPVSQWKPRDQAWANVALGIRHAIDARVVDLALSVMKQPASRIVNDHGLPEASRRYIQGYLARYGHIKVLGMSEPVPLLGVYTAVQFVDPAFRRRFRSVEAMQSAFIDKAGRDFSKVYAKRSDGLDVANEVQFLNVLGEPGSGKSTFLKRMGLEALQPEEHRTYKHMCLPVLVELRTFKSSRVDLLGAIQREFQACGFEPQFARAALEEGQLLVLLDGLDEVPAGKLDEVVSQISQFVDAHANSRFITSCRTAFYQSYFKRFKDVALAHFDNSQVRTFIERWFRSPIDVQRKTAETLWTLLSHPDRGATLELARTPLLLTFLCLVYDSNEALPANRSDLYEEALRILMEKWAAENRRRQDTLYRNMTTKLEMLLLERIAEPAFAKGKMFFKREDLASVIETFLRQELNAPKHLDGNHVLRTIEVEQGLLVERAHNVYSFSHLTLQEYLTARHLRYQNEVERIVKTHGLDRRWREVILLMAGMANVDAMLRALSKVADKALRQEKIVSTVSAWMSARVAGEASEASRIARMSLLVSLFRSRARATIRDRTIREPRKDERPGSRDRALVANPTEDIRLARDVAVALDGSLKSVVDEDIRMDVEPAPTSVVETSRTLLVALRRHRVINEGIAGQIEQSLLACGARKLEKDASLKDRELCARRIRAAYASGLFGEAEVATPDERSVQGLERYLYIVLLMVDVKRAALSVSVGAWDRSLEEMFKHFVCRS